uniref:Uncharacterized protein n=1 Tax=Meloidogyne enterolobii TaxID=390850 RepID=A0A6V7W903_MELEN|nr:unnamed protein product [Meloidogyne enterolobii]
MLNKLSRHLKLIFWLKLKNNNLYLENNANQVFLVSFFLHNQSNDLIKLQTNFNNLQLKSIDEEEKKNSKNKFDHKNQIDEIKNNFQKLIDENIKQLKDENVRKDEKINSLEEEIKKANDLTDKKFGDLFNFNNLNSVVSLLNNMIFVKIKNKWKEIDSRYTRCCSKNCINTNKPIGNCIEGYGFVNIIDDENIKYLLGKRYYDNFVRVCAKNPFKNPRNYFNYSLYYFEIKCKFEKELNGSESDMNIGLENCSKTNYIFYRAKDCVIYNEKDDAFKPSTFSWNNNDIFGCGLVYPPTNISNEFLYVFFTQNGKQIDKGILFKNNFDSYKPYVKLYRCSVEANFGSNLELKPFKYDISKHTILKEFF